MKACGITTVRIAEFAWNKIEPRKNEFNFHFFDRFLFFVLNYGKVGQEIELKKSMYDMETKENLTGTAAIGPYGVAVYRMPFK